MAELGSSELQEVWMKIPSALRAGLGVVLLAGMAGAAAAQPFDRNWDWRGNKRMLTFCVDGGTPALIAGAARFAASNLANAGFGWNLVDAGACPAGWNLRRPMAGQPDIRVRAAALGAIQVPPAVGGPYPHDSGGAPSPSPYPYPYPYPSPSPPGPMPNPNDQPVPGGAPAFAAPPLAYFQPGPFMPGGGRQIQAGEIVFNWQMVNGMVNPPWSINIGDATFDPREVGMHEFGHAIRLLHDDTNFDGDTSLKPTGSRPGANAAIIRPAAGMPVASRILGDDKVDPVTGDLTAGADGVADSGKKMCVMAANAILGQHGINPLLGFPPNSAYSYTDKEQNTARAAAAHIPPGAGMGVHIAAGIRRSQSWNFLDIVDDLVLRTIQETHFPGVVANDLTMDYIAAVKPGGAYIGSVNASSPDVMGASAVMIYAELGAMAAANTTAAVQVWVPFSPRMPTWRSTRTGQPTRWRSAHPPA
jgi:hypothetical protein